LGGREAGESIEGNDGFHFGRVRGRVYVKKFLVTRAQGGVNIFFLNILRDGHKEILFLTFLAWEIFVITIIIEAFELVFSHFSPGQFLDF
jgi:hypothetical protein